MQDTTGTFPEATSNISLKEYGDVLRRRRAIILQTFVIILVGGVLVTLFTAPTYQSTARLLLEAPSYNINSISTTDPLADLFRVNQTYSIPTQVEMLQEPEIRKMVAQKLGVAQLPGMNIQPLEGTQIIEVTSEGDNPELVASAPNELLQQYIDKVEGGSKKTLMDVLNLARRNATTTKGQLNKLDADIDRFKKNYKVTELDATKVELLKNSSNQSDQLRVAETELKVAQDKGNALRQQIRLNNVTPNIQDVTNLQADARIQQIDDTLTTLRAQQRVLLVTYKDNGDKSTYDADGVYTGTNDELRKVKRQIEIFDARRKELVNSFVVRNQRLNPQYASLNNDLIANSVDQAAASAKINKLTEQLAITNAQLAKFPAQEHKWNRMQRELAAASETNKYFTNRANELELRAETKKGGSRILQRAEVPLSPIRPKRVQNIALAGVLGLFFGLCLALLQELFDDRINSPEEAERVLRLPSLGHVPLIEEEGLRLLKDTSTFSPLMEAYRSLRTNINFAAVGNPVRSVVITSSVPAEGKSTTVANLAMAMALESKRVIVVDADLRRPSQHKLFRLDSSPGLTDILVGTHTVEEVLRETGVENVRVLPAGSPPPNPAELLGSAAMGRLLSTLEGMADIILLDSPPTLAVADSIVLASRTHGALLVVGYGETKKTNTKKALDLLSRANANVLGTVLNRMDGPSSGYYYGKYYVPGTERRGPATTTGGAVTASVPSDRALTDSGAYTNSDKKDES